MALQPNELRIGNFLNKSLLSKNGRTLSDKVSVSDIVRINDKTGSFTYEPIPLDEEWFLKFGFTKENPDYFVKYIDDYKYCFRFADFRNDWGFYIEYTDSPFSSDEGRKYFVSCGNSEVIGTGTCYVHQLQNLWFSLTRTELVA